MKVLNLGCAQSHVFEGWFGSEADFQSQLDSGLLECPVCGDRRITKRLSAPRLNLRTGTDSPEVPVEAPSATSEQTGEPPAVALHEMQARWLRAMREVMAKAEDVGERFANEARRMHYGEAEHRNIRGHTTVSEAVELVEEGIEVMPLPHLPLSKDKLQ